MKRRMDLIGMLVLICMFISFYFITSLILDKVVPDKEIENDEIIVDKVDSNYNDEKDIVNRLYQNARMLYDVVNSKFKVDQEDIIVMNGITYKKIVNFEETMGSLFTDNGIDKYISDLGSYFAYTDDKYYLAGNLVSYQTYYFRGDTTNIYVLDANDTEINGIIYEKWTSSSKNTLATIKVVLENNNWLIDNISILANE